MTEGSHVIVDTPRDSAVDELPWWNSRARRAWFATGGGLVALGLGLGSIIPILDHPARDERLFPFHIEPPEGGDFVFGASTGRLVHH